MSRKIEIVRQNWHLISVWTKYNLQAKYVNTKLGFVWIILQPIGLTVIYTIVFSNLIKRKPEGDVPFILFFLAGMMIWQFFSSSMMSSSNLIVRNLRMFGQIKFSRAVIILIDLIENLADFFAIFVVFVLFNLFLGFAPTSTYLYLPVLLTAILLFTLGSMFFLSTLGVFIRDLPTLTSLVLRFLFYFSGVIFSAEMMPDEMVKYLKYNPLLTMIEAFRGIVIYSRPPDPNTLLSIFLISLFVLVVGILFFRSREGTFVDYE